MDKAQPLRKRKRKCLCQSDHGPKRLCNREDSPVNDDEKMRDPGKSIDDSALDRNTWRSLILTLSDAFAYAADGLLQKPRGIFYHEFK